ncbi:glycosyltransferase [Planotetraspora kaengkrachanensis]|uniref:glycosyltransferase n=1 Tax=Planotetraspora kaengkrachanensis TaxID=575193 RepID=UPI001943BDD5|nr:glycosyltransferase [Planotetraspora kaengkrachanensis]
MSDLRVCEVTKTLDLGGVEVLLVERLLKAREGIVNYTVICLRASTDELIQRLRSAGITVIDLTAGPRPLVYARLVTAVRRVAPHVLNVHSPAPLIVLRPFVRLARKRPALVSTVHNERWPKTMYLDRLTRWLDDCTVAVSPLVARSRAVIGARRVLTRMHGVDVQGQRWWAARASLLRRELNLPEDSFLFACVANFRPQKNHRLLLQAAAEVVRRRPDAVFALAGDGPLRDEVVRDVEARGLGDHVRVLGRLPRAARLVAAADLLVLSSDHEGLPVVVMEALAAGVPVVSTRVGGVPDLIASGRNGILTEPGSAGALAEAMLRGMEPQTHRELRAGALASAESVDMAGTAEWFEELYAELARDVKA